MSTSVTSAHDAGPSARRKWLGLAALCAAFFMVILDVAIVNVALPAIQVDLGFSQQNLQWIVSAYALTFGGLLLLGGRIADLIGRRRVFITGVALFSAASLIAGLSSTEATLIGARAFQGNRGRRRLPGGLGRSAPTTFSREARKRNKALGTGVLWAPRPDRRRARRRFYRHDRLGAGSPPNVLVGLGGDAALVLLLARGAGALSRADALRPLPAASTITASWPLAYALVEASSEGGPWADDDLPLSAGCC